MRPDYKSTMKIENLEEFDPNIIKGHPLYYFEYTEYHPEYLPAKHTNWTASIWWAGNYQRFVATGVIHSGQYSYTVADADYDQLIKKIFEKVIN